MEPDELAAARVLRNPTCVQRKLPAGEPVLVPVNWRRIGKTARPRALQLHGG